MLVLHDWPFNIRCRKCGQCAQRQQQTECSFAQRGACPHGLLLGMHALHPGKAAAHRGRARIEVPASAVVRVAVAVVHAHAHVAAVLVAVVIDHLLPHVVDQRVVGGVQLARTGGLREENQEAVSRIARKKQ